MAPAPPGPNTLRRLAVQAFRGGVFVLILLLIHRQHAWHVEQKRGALKQPVALAQVAPFFPAAASLSDWDPAHGGQNVLDAAGKVIGQALQTSPEADGVVGFSGPTNTLLAFGPDRRLVGAAVLHSEDTREHTATVVKDPDFLRSWNGLDATAARDLRGLDGVSGATLTSMAIADGIAVRLGGKAKAERFPEPVTLDEVRRHLPDAAALEPVADRPGRFLARATDGSDLGFVVRTSPFADHLIGYQGPTDLLVVCGPDSVVRAIVLRRTFDNEPYVKLMLDDPYFLNLFTGFTLDDLARLDLVAAEVDGVTGATKTSINVAESLVLAAGEWRQVRPPPPPRPWIALSARDLGTLAVVVAGLAISFTRLKGAPRLRLAFQAVLVGYLGLVNGDMLSQALLVGWARSGVAWQGAPALVALSAAALLTPLMTRHQVYCSHLCPFGALQDWTRKLPRKITPPARLDRALRWIPFLLLAWVVGVALTHARHSLVAIEPFDAFIFRIAGPATLAVAGAGLLASLFINRAYCKFGCPTGALLNFLRGVSADRLGRRDAAAGGLALLALGLMLLRQAGSP